MRLGENKSYSLNVMIEIKIKRWRYKKLIPPSQPNNIFSLLSTISNDNVITKTTVTLLAQVQRR